jgi:L-alanine-DL-glutamate epimerase-like enolase superfamily enzyme
MLHFASCVPNSGPWQEYKEGIKQYADWFKPALRIIDGAITVPQGPGVGIFDPGEIFKGAELVAK